MLWRKPPEAIVVGAGPVGLVTALSLVRRGVRIQIIDEAWRAAAHSYALALHPRSLALLDQLGVLDAVLQDAYRVRRVQLLDGREPRARVNLSALDEDFSFVAVLRQDRLEEILVKALAEHDVKVQWSHRLARLEPAEDGVDVTVHRLDKEPMGYAIAHSEWVVAGSKDYRVPFLVGCDGHHSLVRRQLKIDFPVTSPARHFAVFECTTDRDFDHEMQVILRHEDTNAVWPLPGGHCRFSFEMPGYDHPEERRFKNRLIVELGVGRYPILEEGQLEGLIRERMPWFDSAVADIDWRLVVRFENRLATSFGTGRTWLAGDAAHMTGPVGIQSMNVGLAEGHELATSIAAILKGRADLSALEEYGDAQLDLWRQLHGLDGDLTAEPKASPWLKAHASTLRAALPGFGADLDAQLRQLGLSL